MLLLRLYLTSQPHHEFLLNLIKIGLGSRIGKERAIVKSMKINPRLLFNRAFLFEIQNRASSFSD